MDDIYRYVALKCHEGLISDGRISYQSGVIDDAYLFEPCTEARVKHQT